MRTSVRLGRIRGIEIDASWSFFVITALVGMGLAYGVLPHLAPRHAKWEYGLAGALTAVGFMATVAAHELAHATVARSQHIRPERISLWMLGGVTKLEKEPETARAETLISASGPLTSLGIGVVAAATSIGLSALHVVSLLAGSLAWLGAMNILLALLNLLPASPLDGGHLLHALVWKLTGKQLRAAAVAARSGQVIGWAMVITGALASLYGFLAGLWIALTGWMIASGAAVEGGRARTESALFGLTAADVMIPTPIAIPGWLTVEAVMEDGLAGPARPALPVERWGGGLAGVVGLEQLYALPKAERSRFRVIDLSWPIEEVPLVMEDDPASDVVVRFQSQSPWAVVLAPDGSTPVGVISGPALLARAAMWGHRRNNHNSSSATYPG